MARNAWISIDATICCKQLPINIPPASLFFDHPVCIWWIIKKIFYEYLADLPGLVVVVLPVLPELNYLGSIPRTVPTIVCDNRPEPEWVLRHRKPPKSKRVSRKNK